MVAILYYGCEKLPILLQGAWGRGQINTYHPRQQIH